MTNEEAIKVLEADKAYLYPDECYNAGAYDMAIEELKNERPHGKWIKKCERAGAYVGDSSVYSYTCPFCGEKEFAIYPFCHCGADMREADDDNKGMA